MPEDDKLPSRPQAGSTVPPPSPLITDHAPAPPHGAAENSVSSIVHTVSTVIGTTNVALPFESKTFGHVSDAATLATSLYDNRNDRSIVHASAKVALDIGYDRMATGAATAAGRAVGSLATGAATGLYGAEASALATVAGPVVGAAVGAGIYLGLTNDGTRHGVDELGRSVAAVVARTYGQATQRAGEAYHDLERNIYNLYGVSYQ